MSPPKKPKPAEVPSGGTKSLLAIEKAIIEQENKKCPERE